MHSLSDAVHLPIGPNLKDRTASRGPTTKGKSGREGFASSDETGLSQIPVIVNRNLVSSRPITSSPARKVWWACPGQHISVRPAWNRFSGCEMRAESEPPQNSPDGLSVREMFINPTNQAHTSL